MCMTTPPLRSNRFPLMLKLVNGLTPPGWRVSNRRVAVVDVVAADGEVRARRRQRDAIRGARSRRRERDLVVRDGRAVEVGQRHRVRELEAAEAEPLPADGEAGDNGSLGVVAPEVECPQLRCDEAGVRPSPHEDGASRGCEVRGRREAAPRCLEAHLRGRARVAAAAPVGGAVDVESGGRRATGGRPCGAPVPPVPVPPPRPPPAVPPVLIRVRRRPPRAVLALLRTSARWTTRCLFFALE